MTTDARHFQQALIAISAAGFASAFGFRLCDAMLPALAREFSATTAEASWTITAFAITYGLLPMFFGPLGDRNGKFRVAGYATLGLTAGAAGAALSGSLTQLIAFRALAGVAGAGVIPLGMAWIGDRVSYAERQSTIARFMSASILGIAGGQLAGGVVTDTLGWRAAFVFLAIVYLITGLAMLAMMRRADPRPVLSPEAGMPAGAPPPTGSVARLLADRWVRRVVLSAFAEGVGVFGALAFVPSYLHARFGLTLAVAGSVSALYAIGGLACSLAATRLLRRMGERGLARGGAIVTAAALACVAIAPHWGASVPAMFALGFGFYMLHLTLQTHATQMYPSARGLAVAVFAVAYFAGQSVGVAVAALLVEAIDTRWMFAGSAVIALAVGTIFAAALASRRQHPA